MHKLRFALAVVLAGCASTSLAYGTYNIYGIHFYGGSPAAETTIKNGKGMYSVEMIFTDDWKNMNKDAERTKLLNIKNKGFKVILRLDYKNGNPGYTIPGINDWNGRYFYAVDCGSIAQKMADVVDIYIIGNEMTTHPRPECRDALWYAKVYNGYDNNSAYDKIKANDSSATVLMGALTAWPYYVAEIDGDNINWFRTVQDNVDQSGGKPIIDGYALHAYSAKEYYNDQTSATEDPRFSDVTGLKSYVQFLKKIYEKHGAYIPVHITETNTYWFYNTFSSVTYRDNWTKEAFQTIDEWNRSSDLKIDSFCWFVYSHLGITDPNSDIWQNSIMRTDNARLTRAREDFAWVTANKNMAPGNPGSTLHFEAENYTNSAEWINDVGLHDTDYWDADNDNQGGQYRNGSVVQPHVDIAYLPDYSGFTVGWMTAGEWLRYETIAGGRNYRIKVRYARGATGTGSVSFLLGTTAIGTVNLPATGSWSTYSTVTGPTFYMPAGYHYIKLNAVSGNTNIDWFEFEPI